MNRRTVLTAAAVGAGLTLASLALPAVADEVGEVLRRAARPLRTTEPGGSVRDLAPFDSMVEGVRVVGVGEATHNSRQFFTMKHRMFRYLVRRHDFASFAQEVHTGAGLRIDDYVTTGSGDIRAIMRDEFQGGTRLWNTREYLDLFEWMRRHNAEHESKLRYMGNDIDYPAPELFLRIDDHLRRHRPGLRDRVARLYQGLRPESGMTAWLRDYPALPRQRRRELSGDADQAVDLLRDTETAIAWYARVIAQVARLYSFDMEDPEQLRGALRHREESMAGNTIDWCRATGHRALLSAHNGHVAYVSTKPEYLRAPQGAVMRDRLGDGYLSIGFTFNRGGFNAFEPGGDTLRPVTVGPAEPGSNEHALERVLERDFILDLRTVPSPGREWLNEYRPGRDIGAQYPEPYYRIALRRFHDVLIHLHRIDAADLL